MPSPTLHTPPFGNTLNHPVELGQRLSEARGGLNIIYQLLRNTFITLSSSADAIQPLIPDTVPGHTAPGCAGGLGWTDGWDGATAAASHRASPRSQPLARCGSLCSVCAPSAPQQQQLGRTIVQTQEGSDSRVSRAGRNQQHRHLVSRSLWQPSGRGQQSEGMGGRAALTPRSAQ